MNFPRWPARNAFKDTIRHTIPFCGKFLKSKPFTKKYQRSPKGWDVACRLPRLNNESLTGIIRMNRLASFLVFAAVSAASLCGQDVVSSVQVSTFPSGAMFTVDGTQYTAAAFFTWAKGSKHTLSFVANSGPTLQANDPQGTQYSFGGWKDSKGQLLATSDIVQVVTADPSITSYVASVSVLYRVQLILQDPLSSPGLPPVCGAPGSQTGGSFRAGVVYLSGTCYWADATVYLPAGVVSLNAFPYPGYVFDGWTSNIGALDSSLRQFVLQSAITLAARFSPAKRVRFLTSPPNFSVLIDRTPTPTTSSVPCATGALQPPFITGGPFSGQSPLCLGEFDFANGSQHILSAPSPQSDQTGNLFVFDSWSIGGGQNTIYTANTANIPDLITAKFVPGARVSFLTTPTVLKLKVDGRDNWPSLNFVWAIGSKYTVTAPAEQFDAAGRKYVFKGWSNGGAATQDIVVDANAATNGGLRLIANYDLLNRAVIGSTVPSLKVKVDGIDCLTPCLVDRPNGGTASVSVPLTIPLSDVSRYEFTVWQDGGGADRTVNFNKDYQTVNANYRISNKLTAVADPEGGADFRFDPPSADGFYPADVPVTVTAAVKPGFKFRRWEGDLDGTFRTGSVFLSVPRIVRAMLDRVPYIAPAGVKNSAGDTPAQGVAAGSIISIYGANLATRYEVGPANPLAQSIAGVVLLLGDRILPIVYVSPEQINAQLPDDLVEGAYSLTVKNEGFADVTAPFTVVRNAPGLFYNTINQKQYVLALHEDGTAVTPDSPARRNEMVTLLGTGFGPYTRRVPEGFAVPDTPVASIADPAEVVAGALRLQPAFTGAAPGLVGVASSKIRISADLPGASSVELRIVVNGQDSNTVLLPVE